VQYSKQFYRSVNSVIPNRNAQNYVLDGGKNLTKNSKKEKNAGMEKHRQALREKKMKKKAKKKVTIPSNYRKK